MIPEVEIDALMSQDPKVFREADRKVFAAATSDGFLVLRGMSPTGDLGLEARETLLQIFKLSEAAQRKLWKRNFEPANPNLYRGFFPLHSGAGLYREGFEIGPDVVRPIPESDDVLYEPSVFPAEASAPGLVPAARAWYLAMEVIGQRVLCAVSRGLGIPERIFADAFRDGISTLRLLHYIPRGDLPISDEERESRGEHVDSGLLTLLAFCCGCGGLQVKTRDGEWIDVPAEDDVIAVNFGGLMARWTGGKIRATPHGVIPTREERFSIPFFFEPRPDTRIEPLPLPEVEPFEPFLFGDHLWNTTTRFAENYGLGPLRPNRAPYRDPLARVE